MAYLETARHDRLRAIAAVALLHIVAGTALIRGFDIDVTAAPAEALEVFDLTAPAPPAPPPPPPLEFERDRAAREEGASAPPALEARPKPIAAPERRVEIPVDPPIAAPKVAADGAESTPGAAPTPGPGTGAGGQGVGTGSGNAATGPGGGGSGASGAGTRTPARLISGQITRRDYPASAWREGLSKHVTVFFTVGPDGRATGCDVTASSGNPRVDAITCRTIEVSFRYEPARNARGEPVSTDMAWTQRLWTERD